MNLRWHVSRLRRMGLREIAHRLVERARRSRSRNRHEGWEHYPAPPLRSVFPDWAARVRAAGPVERSAIAAAAARILAGEFEALSRRWPDRDPEDLFPRAVWSVDPVTASNWPTDSYCFDIDYRDGQTRGDVKYVWEFNRLQMLPVLAAHALLSDDPRAVAAIEAAISSWYEANPPFRGIAWASGIEVALRAISLAATLSLVGERLSSETHQRTARILSAAAFWLPRFPSLYSSANNHRIAELAGEIVVSVALGADFTRNRDALVREIERQILSDGAPAEQSPTYGAFSAELLLLAVAAAGRTATPFPAVVDERLAGFANFVSWIGPFRYGDDDEGRVLALGQGASHAATVAAAISGDVAMAGAVPGLLLLLAGRQPRQSQHGSGLKTFSAGGLTIWRGELAGRSIELSLDHGPLGYLSIAAHGHADALAFTLAIDGREVLVDPGTYLYGSGGAWREWFRSTAAHNTLNLEGASQSEPAGPFNWSRHARASLVDARPGAHWSLTARHDGYRRRFGAIHERRVERDGEEIVVVDRLVGRAQRAELVFQLAHGLSAERQGNAVLIRDSVEAIMAIEFADGTVDIPATREDQPSSGWVSPHFGVKVPAPRIVWRGEVGEAGITTRLRPIGKFRARGSGARAVDEAPCERP